MQAASKDYEAKEDNYVLHLAKAKEVTNVDTYESGIPREQLVELEVLGGKDKGIVYFSNNAVPDSLAYSIIAKLNKKYIIAVDNVTGETFITDFYRQPILMFLLAAFFALLFLLGGMKGLKAIVSLVLVLGSIVYVLLPMIKWGVNPIFAAILISAFATACTMLMIAGRSNKALAATIGTTGGVAVAGILAFAIVKVAPLSGLASSEARILLGNLGENGFKFDFQGVLSAGILIASLGAAMDVAISVASSAQEIHNSNANLSRASLFLHAMNVGRDIMGTMSNTLVLAYTGSAIPLFLLLMNEPMVKILNMEVIVTEVAGAIVGSIGLLLAIPITAVASVVLYKKEQDLLNG